MTGAGVEGLYPFLYSEAPSPDDLFAEIRQSTLDKIDEITALRAEVAARYTGALQDAAVDLAAAFRAGATVFAFGNGGSSTDAETVVALFANPGDDHLSLPA